MIAFILEHLHNIEMCNGKHMGRSGNPDYLRVKRHSVVCRFTTNNMDKNPILQHSIDIDIVPKNSLSRDEMM